MSKINDPAILAERRLLRAQLRSLGLAPNAVVEIAARAGGQTSAALSEELTRTAGPIEARHALVQFRDVEFRDAQGTGDGSYTLTGYAAVYGVETVLYDGSWWRFREVIAPEAFVPVLGRTPDVHLNIGHDMTRAIARTGIDGVGGLELASDDQGLRVFARLDPADPDVVSLAAKMNRGIVDQMSFAFTIARAKYESEIDEEADFEDELRTILEIGELYDTAVCAQGAYSQTSAELAVRSLVTALGRAGVDLAGQLKHRDNGSGVNATTTDDDGDEPAEVDVDVTVNVTVTAENTETTTGDDADDAQTADDSQRARKAQTMRIRIALDD